MSYIRCLFYKRPIEELSYIRPITADPGHPDFPDGGLFIIIVMIIQYISFPAVLPVPAAVEYNESKTVVKST